MNAEMEMLREQARKCKECIHVMEEDRVECDACRQDTWRLSRFTPKGPALVRNEREG